MRALLSPSTMGPHLASIRRPDPVCSASIRRPVAPETPEGRELLVHEITHVVQPTADFLPGDSIDPCAAKAEADHTAQTIVHGGRIERGALHRTEVRSPAKTEKTCDPTNHEGNPLIWLDRDAPARSHRPATGYAQERLNAQLSIVFDCLLDPSCRSSLPKENVAFIESLLSDLEVPLEPDCKFGPQTERATKIVQAFYFIDRAEWDGKIGDLTWSVIAPPGPTLPIPNAPVPIPSARYSSEFSPPMKSLSSSSRSANLPTLRTPTAPRRRHAPVATRPNLAHESRCSCGGTCPCCRATRQARMRSNT